MLKVLEIPGNVMSTTKAQELQALQQSLSNSHQKNYSRHKETLYMPPYLGYIYLSYQTNKNTQESLVFTFAIHKTTSLI